jgi:Cu+-exporting ATPase
VSGKVEDREIAVGTARFMKECGFQAPDAGSNTGETVSFAAELSPNRRLLGELRFKDVPRRTSHEAVSRLKEMGVELAMLTGDSEASAAAISREIGIAAYQAECLPEEKARFVGQLSTAGRTVAMVGDGINDAPALAAADVGIAMSTGTDVAMHAAGVTLMRGDPALVADALDISRRTHAKIRQNLFWAFVYNAIGIPLAALGLLSPVIAGAAMALSSVSVVTNALALRRWRGIAR